MKIAQSIAIVGIWLSVALALFVTQRADVQPFIGLIGFMCAVVGTMFILMTSSEKKEVAPPKSSGGTDIQGDTEIGRGSPVHIE